MPHGRLRYDIYARFGAHRCASARVGSRDPVVDSVLIAGHAGLPLWCAGLPRNQPSDATSGAGLVVQEAREQAGCES
jgi:hypothetical protein